MNYYSPADGPPDHDPEDGSAQAHDPFAAPAVPREEAAVGIDHILLALMQEIRRLGIPLCAELVVAARQAIADRLQRGEAAPGD